MATGRGTARTLPLRWRRRAAVVAGGMIGGAGRIGVSALLPSNGGMPWGTLAANLSGALLLGYVLTRLLQAGRGARLGIPLLCTGVLGSYTTFSTFSLETWQLLEADRAGTALAYAAISVTVGLAAAAAGVRLGERHA